MTNYAYEMNPISRIICGKWQGELETAESPQGKDHRLNLTIGALSWRAQTGCNLTVEAQDRIYDYTKFEWIMESQLNESQRSICEAIFEKMPDVFNNFAMVRIDIRETKERNNNDNEPKKMKIRQSHRLIFNKEGLKRASNYFCESLQGTGINDNNIPGFIHIKKPKFDIKIKSKVLLNFLEHINDPENLTINSENFFEIYSLSIFYGSKEIRKKCLDTKVNYNVAFLKNSWKSWLIQEIKQKLN